MDREMFEKLLSESTKKLPQEFLEKLENVALTVQDFPDEYQLKQNGYTQNQCLLGLYEGVPQTQRGNYNQVLPDKITLFQKNIELVAQDNPEKIKSIITTTLWHEIGHHFGLDEKEVGQFIQRKFNSN